MQHLGRVEGTHIGMPVAELSSMFQAALSQDVDLSPLKGLKLNISGNSGFHKLFFASSCECGVSALLSVDVANSKTRAEVKNALPTLLTHLRSREQAFRSMSCETHAQMQKGGLTAGAPSKRPGVGR